MPERQLNLPARAAARESGSPLVPSIASRRIAWREGASQMYAIKELAACDQPHHPPVFEHRHLVQPALTKQL